MASLLNAVAVLFGRAERALFVDRHVYERPLKECKREFIREFGLTARQFNAVRVGLDGKMEAVTEGQKVRIAHLQEAIVSAEKAVKKTARDLGKLKGPDTPDVEQRRRLRFALHQKKRWLFTLKSRLAAAEADQKAGRIRVCFGGKKLFHAQFYLKANGFSDRAAWEKAWRERRSSQFLCLGSKDETAGNQTCTRMPDGSLRLRVPPKLEAEFGRYVLIPGVKFSYDQAEIDAAISRGEAITYRFLQQEKKDQPIWYIHATVERPDAKVVTDRRLGALGVDFNPSHIDVGEIDRFGNVVGTRTFSVDLGKKHVAQATAILSDVAANIVDWAKVSGKPLVVEELDFQKKKAALREMSPRYARMLSAFSYRKFFQLLYCRASREGVEVIDEDGDGKPGVNPAFTSVIGAVKFASGYGLSSHCAAAVAIARRGLKFGERLRSRFAFPLPARNRGKHVWSGRGTPVPVARRGEASEEACGPKAAGRKGPGSAFLRGRPRQGGTPILGGTYPCP